MLWMKNWLETRWRMCLMLGFGVLTLLMAEQGGGLGSVEHARNLLGSYCLFSIITALNLAGAGIRTQSSFRHKAGLHGSTHYTLSLPVSRFRLLSVRAIIGLIETIVVITFLFVSAWSLFSLVRGESSLLDLSKQLVAGYTCVLCFYFLSVAISTVLDEMWQWYGSLLVVVATWWASQKLPASANLFHFATDASPLVTHTLPWPAMTLSILISAILFLAALFIVKRAEY